MSEDYRNGCTCDTVTDSVGRLYVTEYHPDCPLHGWEDER